MKSSCGTPLSHFVEPREFLRAQFVKFEKICSCHFPNYVLLVLLNLAPSCCIVCLNNLLFSLANKNTNFYLLHFLTRQLHVQNNLLDYFTQYSL